MPGAVAVRGPVEQQQAEQRLLDRVHRGEAPAQRPQHGQLAGPAARDGVHLRKPVEFEHRTLLRDPVRSSPT